MGKLLLSPKENTGNLLGEFDAFVGEEEEGKGGLVDFFLFLIHSRKFRRFSKRREGRVAG